MELIEQNPKTLAVALLAFVPLPTCQAEVYV